MYNRLVTGMIRQQEHALHRQQCSRSLDSLYETGACIANIQRTRYEDPGRGHDKSSKSTEEITSTPVDCTNGPKVSTEAVGFLASTAPRFEEDDEVFILDF